MKALVINCSPVRNGATAEIVSIVSQELSKKFMIKRDKRMLEMVKQELG